VSLNRTATTQITEPIEQHCAGDVPVIKFGNKKHLSSSIEHNFSPQLEPDFNPETVPAPGQPQPRPPTLPVPASAHQPLRQVQLPKGVQPVEPAQPSAAPHVNALLAAKLSGTQKAGSSQPFSLDSFIQLKKATVAVEQPISFASRQRIRQAKGSAAAAAEAAAASQPGPIQPVTSTKAVDVSRIDPPYGELTLARPGFEVDVVSSGSAKNKTYRIAASHEFLQMRATYRAVNDQPGLYVVDRPMRWQAVRGRQLEPHLVLDGVTCVIFRRLATVAGNAIRKAGAPIIPGKNEAWSETLLTMASFYDRVLLVAVQSVGPGVPASWTPPNVKALNELAVEIISIETERPGSKVEVAFAAGDEEVGEVVKAYTEWVESKARSEEEKTKRMGVVGSERSLDIDLWGPRAWLEDDMTKRETSFLQSSDLNTISASAIASVVGLDYFVYQMTKAQRRDRFSNVCGYDRMVSSAFAGAVQV